MSTALENKTDLDLARICTRVCRALKNAECFFTYASLVDSDKDKLSLANMLYNEFKKAYAQCEKNDVLIDSLNFINERATKKYTSLNIELTESKNISIKKSDANTSDTL